MVRTCERAGLARLEAPVSGRGNVTSIRERGSSKAEGLSSVPALLQASCRSSRKPLALCRRSSISPPTPTLGSYCCLGRSHACIFHLSSALNSQVSSNTLLCTLATVLMSPCPTHHPAPDLLLPHPGLALLRGRGQQTYPTSCASFLHYLYSPPLSPRSSLPCPQAPGLWDLSQLPSNLQACGPLLPPLGGLHERGSCFCTNCLTLYTCP